MKEIGGYIEFEHYHGKEFHQNALKLNCSRNALAYLIKLHGIKKNYIPCFLCGSVFDVCKRHEVKIEFYHIGRDFLPEISKIPDGGWLYIVNYYGQLENEKIKELSLSVENLIVDNVQAFFQLPVPHVPTIYNCRKFFGVADGAYLYSDKKLDEEIGTDFSYARMEFLLGRFEKSATEFYPEYMANNDFFDTEPVKRMSAMTENIMRSVDYEFVESRRTENFGLLHRKLSRINQLDIKVPKGAFMYPLLIENGEDIRKELQKRKIYIPALWLDVVQNPLSSKEEISFAKNILPLPCDQRYGKEEMEYIAQEILR